MPPYQRQAEPSKGTFLSWDAGESKDLVILSEKGTKTETHWVDGKANECSGAGCVFCTSGVRKTLRWTVLTLCEHEELPWEMSNTTFFGVEDVAAMVGHLKDLRLRVTRYGTGLKTRYSVLPITGEDKAPKQDPSMAWYASEIKRLCALANMDPKQELKLYLTEVAPDMADADPFVRMQCFYQYIDKETMDLQEPDEPPPDEPQDIGRYF